MKPNQNIKKTFVFIPLLVLSYASSAAPNYHHPEQFLKTLEGKDQQTVGQAIYSQFCSTCHSKNPTIPLGAPRIGIMSDWDERQKSRSLNEMLKEIDSGLNAMPPRGGCFECSDQQLLAAIEYLLTQPKRK